MAMAPGAMAQLPYPDRFYSAAAYVGLPSASAPSSPSAASSLPTKRISVPLSEAVVLLLYGLYKQATLGPCTVPKPWGWNAEETAKWTSWNHFGNMNSMEAMRLFVRALEDVDPNWLAKSEPQRQEVPDRAALESASKELTKLLLEKDVPRSPRNSQSDVVAPCVTNGHSVDNVVTSSKKDIEVKKSEPKPEMEVTVKEGIEAITTYHEWVPLSVTGRKPLARYQHAAAIVEGKLYVTGGNHNGRYLNDVHVLDLKKLEWSKVDTKVPQSPLSSQREPLQPWFPQCAGHSLVRWGRKLLAVAGHSKDGSDTVSVHAFDTYMLSWTKLDVFGQSPVARGGQTVTLIGSQLYMFGGEDLKRRQLNDLNVLDMETLTWETVVASGVCPSPRSDHVAAAYSEKYLFIFGGGSQSSCYRDLHVLDLDSMQWSPVQTQGTIPSPRAGHAGATLGENWYIVGGGDNRGPISETLVLNMATLEWTTAATVQGNMAVASEGLSVVVSGDSLLAFGGYNGIFSNMVHVFKLASSEKPQPADVDPLVAAVDDTKSDTMALENNPPGDQEVADTQDLEEAQNTAPVESNIVLESHPPPLFTRVASLNDEVGQLRMAALTAQAEVEKLKVENAAALSSLADVEQELQSVRSQLQGEQSRSFQLEVEIAELRHKLNSMELLQKDLDILQRQKVASEKAATEAAQKESSGVWGWLAGAPPAARID